MIERIRKKYAMTEKGAKDYVAAVFWSVLVNISKMLPEACWPRRSPAS